MSNAYLCPILQQNQFTDNANFLAGGLIWSYVAGTTTPQAVYTDSTANTAWPNPIVLNQRGETGGEIWLAAGSSYKFVIEDAPFYGQTHGPNVATLDNITGINDSSALTVAPNWITFTGTPTYISSTSFSVAGDQRPTFQTYRRVKSANSGGTMYGSVSSATFATGVTTVVLINDTGDALDSGLNSVSYGFIETDPSSIPPSFASGTTMLFVQAAAPQGWTKITTYNDYALRIVSGTGGGTGGSVAFSTAFSNVGTTGSTTLSTSQIPSHTHTFKITNTATSGSSAALYASGINWYSSGINFTGTVTPDNTGSGGSHAHSIPSLAVNYIDSIIAIKD
jgi:hypothetical protein